jgi:hypothetical protein
VHFTLPPDAPTHAERIELWPAVALVGTVDVSALPAAYLAAREGETVLVLLGDQYERSYAVDAGGKRLNYTPNTGAFRFGGELTFRLERVTPDVPLRLRALGDELFGETWFRAAPGADARVLLRLLPAGRLAFPVPAAWPTGPIEVDVRVDGTWRPALDWSRTAECGQAGDDSSVARPAGETAWRLVLRPDNGDPAIERTGVAKVEAGRTVQVKLD